jgi:hypothetical protein
MLHEVGWRSRVVDERLRNREIRLNNNAGKVVLHHQSELCKWMRLGYNCI